jgi:hypothetical protein
VVDGIERDYPAIQVFRLDFNDATDATAARALRIPHHPSILLIDADGNAFERILGPPDEATLREVAEALTN